MSELRPRVLVLAGWYPDADNPIAGVFVREQAQALSRFCDVAVLHVRIGGLRPRVSVAREDGLLVVRADRPVGSSRNPRIRAYQTLAALTLGYALSVLSAYRCLHREWGRPDLVHAHVLYPGGYGAAVLQLVHGIPYVVTEHSTEYLPEDGGWALRSRSIRSMVRLAASRSRTVIAVGSYQAASMQALGIPGTYEVVPNVVRECAGGEDDLPRIPGRHRIAQVALLDDRSKDISGLIEAARILRSKRTDFEIHLAGDGADRAMLEKRAADAGLLGHALVFRGLLSPAAVSALQRSSDFAVTSSRFETFSVSTAEALMCGKPVVCTRCGGPEDFVDEQAGALVDRESPTALADAMDKMLDGFADYDSAQIAENARERFSAGSVATRLLTIYRRVLSART
jgi:L-malate glycosyltransferase